MPNPIKTHTNLIVLALCACAPLPGHADCSTAATSQDYASGAVYEDINRNGRRDRFEAGVAGVSVSNGCTVVQTDGGGNYGIQIAANQILFISKPANYELPVDSNNLPQFYYLHYPSGSPTEIDGTPVEWSWPVIPPSGSLPAVINFALYPNDQASPRFEAHGFADTQAYSDLDEDMLREDLINPLIGNPYEVDFGLTMGDVANDNLAIYPRHKALMGLMGMPQWYVPGNHDINFESPNAEFANETYKSHFGPTYYSFNHGDVHFVALNNVEYAGAGREFPEGRYRGFIGEDQLRWLEQDLATVDRDKLIVIATHIGLLARASDGQSEPASGPETTNFDRLLEILQPFDNIYALAGHDTSNSWKTEINHSHGWYGTPWIAHTLAEVRGNGWPRGPQDTRGVRDAMMQDGNPNGFYLLRFDTTRLVPEFIPFDTGPDANRRLRITLDPALVSDTEESLNRGARRGTTSVVVNLFDGGVRDSVSISLDGGDPQAMRYTVRTDPFVERAYARYANSADAFGSPTRSSHIWQWELPEELAPGLHLIEVESVDEFGQQHRELLSFELLE